MAIDKNKTDLIKAKYEELTGLSGKPENKLQNDKNGPES